VAVEYTMQRQWGETATAIQADSNECAELDNLLAAASSSASQTVTAARTHAQCDVLFRIQSSASVKLAGSPGGGIIEYLDPVGVAFE
jgi:hypothetical protein